MRTEDRNKYDSTILGLNNLYVVDNDGNYFINSKSIMVANKTVSSGKTYLLNVHPIYKDGKLYAIKLLDVYYQDERVNLIVRDIITQRIFKIDDCIECSEHHCTWMLIDLDFFIDIMNAKAVRQYCGKYDNTNNKPVAESNHKLNPNDLLEFEF
jgi:hypothetical protein